MIVIEENNELHFYDQKGEIDPKDGFARLDELYQYETAETRRIIENLKRKYQKA